MEQSGEHRRAPAGAASCHDEARLFAPVDRELGEIVTSHGVDQSGLGEAPQRGERGGILQTDVPGQRVDAERARELGQLRELRSEEHTSELQSLMRNSYAVSCWTKQQLTQH